MFYEPVSTNFIPFKELIIPIDKLSNCIFRADLKNFGAIVEDKKSKIQSPVKMILPKGDDGKPINLTPFEKTILIFLISAQADGNKHISYRKLFNLLGGSTNLSHAKNFKAAIDTALWKLRCTDLTIDLSEIVAARKKYANKLNVPYNPKDGNIAKVVWRGVLFPNEVITATINGGKSESVIRFIDDSIILRVADFKDQIIRADLNLFDCDIRITVQTVTLIGYLFERILKIKGSLCKDHVTKLENSISFETLTFQCGVPSSKKDQRQTLLRNVKKILDSFQANNLFKNYDVLKTSDGLSIKIFF